MRLVLDARSASFGALIDNASLFPPASLNMDEAVSAYRTARVSATGWMTGRFLCPSSQLTDLAASLTRSFTANEHPWEVGAVFNGDPGAAASSAQAFHTEMQPAATIASAEAQIVGAEPEDIGAVIDAIISIQPEIVPFIELDRAAPIGAQIASTATELSQRSRVGGVQIRMGSVAKEPSPTVDEVAAFVMGATEHRLPFKAADFRRPIHGHDDDLDASHHGFINILVAAGAAAQGRSLETVTAIIAESDPKAFSMGAAFVSWSGVSIPGPAMRRIRASGFVAFASYDFSATVDALHILGFIGEGA